MENIREPRAVSDDIWIIKCVDYVDAHNAETFEKVIHDSLVKGRVKLVIDFSELNYLASTGCNVLFGNISKARASGGGILVLKPTQPVLEVLELLGAADLLNIVDDIDAAVIFFQGMDGGEPASPASVGKREKGVLEGVSDFDGASVPDPIEIAAFGKTPARVEKPPEKGNGKEKEKKAPKKRRKTVVVRKAPASKPKKEKSRKKARDKKKKKQGKKKKANRGKFRKKKK